MPLPFVYFVMSVLFAISGFFFVITLQSRKIQLKKIHLLLETLVFLKSLGLLLRSSDLYFTSKYEDFSVRWEYFFYVVILIKSQLFFLTIAIIFEKFRLVVNTFLLVVPLQFVASIANIFCQELERGSAHYSTWRDIFVLADILSCVLILIPALSFGQKSSSDLSHLEDMKDYQRFYTVFICYVVLSRIFA